MTAARPRRAKAANEAYKHEVYGDRSRIEVEERKPYKVQGSMEELLATYRELCAQEATADV